MESDKLESYDDLLDWSEQAGLIEAAIGASLRRTALDDEQEAKRVLQRARLLRERLHRVYSALASGDLPDPKSLDGIAAAARKAAARSRLVPREERFAWVLDDAAGDVLDWPLSQLAAAAVRLLTSDSAKRIRRCANASCGWLFVDRSRNHTRRWCDMASCGNRAKARRHYERKRATQHADA